MPSRKRKERDYHRRRNGQYVTIYFPNHHFLDALRAEAELYKMNLSPFMRSMIRGYFAAALHGK